MSTYRHFCDFRCLRWGAGWLHCASLAVTVGLCVGITHGGIGPYTVTLQTSFFFPILQEIFALPTFTAFTFTLVFFFAVRRMFFFPDTIDHLAFLLVFFTLSAAVFPTFIVSFLALSFGVAACDGAAVWQRPAVNAIVKIIAMFFVLMGTHPHTILYFSITYLFYNITIF